MPCEWEVRESLVGSDVAAKVALIVAPVHCRPPTQHETRQHLYCLLWLYLGCWGMLARLPRRPERARGGPGGRHDRHRGQGHPDDAHDDTHRAPRHQGHGNHSYNIKEHCGHLFGGGGWWMGGWVCAISSWHSPGRSRGRHSTSRAPVLQPVCCACANLTEKPPFSTV